MRLSEESSNASVQLMEWIALTSGHSAHLLQLNVLISQCLLLLGGAVFIDKVVASHPISSGSRFALSLTFKF